jgi:hypothetical protein
MIPRLAPGPASSVPSNSGKQAAPTDVNGHRSVAKNVDPEELAVLLLGSSQVLEVFSISGPQGSVGANQRRRPDHWQGSAIWIWPEPGMVGARQHDGWWPRRDQGARGIVLLALETLGALASGSAATSSLASLFIDVHAKVVGHVHDPTRDMFAPSKTNATHGSRNPALVTTGITTSQLVGEFIVVGT